MTDHNIFQEIEEDLQRKKMEDLWKQYGPFIIGLAIAIVLATAASTSWNSWKAKKEQAASAAYISALQTGGLSKEKGVLPDPTKTVEALEKFAAGSPATSQAVFARLKAAGIAMDEGQEEKGLALYQALADDATVEPVFRELAGLLSLQRQIDKGDAAALQTKLEALYPSAAWGASAKELSAHLALKQGDKEKAKKLFQEISQAPTGPAGIQQRAKDMLSWLNEGA